MKILTYQAFINESVSSTKIQLLSHFDENKKDIISKGLNFDKMRSQLSDCLDSLDDKFLNSLISSLSSINLEDKNDFVSKFTNILSSIVHRMDKSVDEGLISGLKSIWNSIVNSIHKAVKWISDKIFTISSVVSLGLASTLLLINEFGQGLSFMPDMMGNVLINVIFLLGFTALSYAIKYEIK